MANEALRQILDWGVENVSETIGGLTDLIEQQARERNIEAIPAKSRTRHMVGLKLGSAVPEDLAARLARERVFVSVRGESVRVSPHLYNTAEDVRRLFEVIEGVL
jgi:selenocysteine lyase/cysteine desulfurase